MTDLKINLQAVLSNTNTTLNALDYDKTNDLIAFAANNLIHIYHISSNRTYLTLKGHKERVNSVKFLNNTVSENKKLEILSVSGDGTTHHWRNQGNALSHLDWKLHRIYNSQDVKSAINVLSCLYLSPQESYYSTFSSNGSLEFFKYELESDQFVYIDSVNSKKKLQEALCLNALNKHNIILMSGGYDSQIHLYTIPRNSDKSVLKIKWKVSLTGHLNSIRDISSINKYNFQTKQNLFASCSQDHLIRIWSINKLKSTQDVESSTKNTILQEYTNKTSFVLQTDQGKYYNILLDSVVSGHDDSVSSIRWGLRENKLSLLSSSFDFTVSLWTPDDGHEQGVWIRQVTLGSLYGNKHSFYSAIFIEDNKSILGYAYNGAFYLWRFKNNEWISEPVMHGHFLPVSDLSWDKTGTFVVSCSEDQTTRIFTTWKDMNVWSEINRPQVHGYDLNTVAFLNIEDGVLPRVVSGGDEKIIRLFEPTFNIVKFLENLAKYNVKFSVDQDNSYYEKYFLEASKQALGLLNKPMKAEINEEDENALEIMNFDSTEYLTNKKNNFHSNHNYSVPPDDDFLTNSTLWPESNKLYGHGYDIVAVACSNKGDLIASSGKAQSAKHSKLFIWNPNNYTLISKLEGHNLTIVKIEFSHNDEFILTVSRDRSWCLYRRTDDSKNPYSLYQSATEVHGRIIWGCSWTIDDLVFATGSRDKIVKIWGKENEGFKEKCAFKAKSAVTDVNFVPVQQSNNNYYLIIGLESGDLQILKLNIENWKIELKHEIHNFLGHSLTVKRIKSFVKNTSQVQVATCSDDHSLRIFDFDLENLKSL